MLDPHTVTWQAPEFEYRMKGVTWYWFTIIIAVLLVALAAWQRNFLFAVFVVIAEMLVIGWGARMPALVTFHIDERELVINDRERYPWSEFASFSGDDGGGTPSLTFRFRRGVRPALHILVPPDRFAEVKEIVAAQLPQVQEQKSFVDVLEEFLRF